MTLQRRFIPLLNSVLKEQLEKIFFEEIQNNQALIVNDQTVDQSQFIKKAFVDYQEEFIAMLSLAFVEWRNKSEVEVKQEVLIKQLILPLLATLPSENPDPLEWLSVNQKLNPKTNKILIGTWFWIQIPEIREYADARAGEMITLIDDFTRKSVNELIAKWIELWWWVNTMRKKLSENYAFSTYRASLIATNEIWQAFVTWWNEQFKKYATHYWEEGYKRWISQRDWNVTEPCMNNDRQGWIAFNEEYSSWDDSPLRFPWCRCNQVRRLFLD